MSFINLSEGFFLAVHSLVLIEQHKPERLSAKFLAQELHSSQAHLAKIFQKLSKAGLVTSVRGPSGGFILSKNPDEISFLDVYEIVEGQVQIGGCVFNKSHCAFSECLFGSELIKISNEVYNKLKNTKISDFE